MLRKGAYAAIMDENDEGSRFCEEDIDQILQRRATTITIESEGKGSTFSKASFVASENRNDIALDDPEFWQKWAKKADIDMDSINQKVSFWRLGVCPTSASDLKVFLFSPPEHTCDRHPQDSKADSSVL